jgi:hypothetical protein
MYLSPSAQFPRRDPTAPAGDNRNPVLAVDHGLSEMPAKVAAATTEYLERHAPEVVLTDSTTMGLTLIYRSLPLRSGQEVLTGIVIRSR